MPSILDMIPQLQTQQYPQSTTPRLYPASSLAPQQNPAPAPMQFPVQQQAPQPNANDVRALVSEILSSPDPKAKFNQLLTQFPELQETMKITEQYGNGDPRTAGINYIAATGKQAAAQAFIQQLGLR